MKKFLALALVLILALSLVACSANTNDTGRVLDNDGNVVQYTVKGKWKFQDTLNLREAKLDWEDYSDDDGTYWEYLEYVTFTCNDEGVDYTCTRMRIAFQGDDNCEISYMSYEHGGAFSAYRINFEYGRNYRGWCTGQTIDFGGEPQEVSKSFYEWFITVADPVKE